MGKFGEFGELSAIRQTKLVLTINNLLADLLIRQTFFCQMLETSQFAKLFSRQTFPLYRILFSKQVHATYSLLLITWLAVVFVHKYTYTVLYNITT